MGVTIRYSLSIPDTRFWYLVSIIHVDDEHKGVNETVTPFRLHLIIIRGMLRFDVFHVFLDSLLSFHHYFII